MNSCGIYEFPSKSGVGGGVISVKGKQYVSSSPMSLGIETKQMRHQSMLICHMNIMKLLYINVHYMHHWVI